MREVFRRPGMPLLFAGQIFSFFGDRMLFIALGIWVKVLTGSNAQAGMVFFFLVVPGLLSPLGGYVVDRVGRRFLLLCIHLGGAAVVMGLLFVRDATDVWIIYLVSLAYGAITSFSASARSALLTVMLPRDLLAEANGTLQTWAQGLRLVTPIAGAAVFSWLGGGVVAVIDAVTFLVSAACLASIHVDEPARQGPSARFREELIAGLMHIRATRTLRDMTIAGVATFLVIGFAETLIFAVTEGLGRSPGFVGVMLSVEGVGAVIGGMTAARVMKRTSDAWIFGIGIALFGLYSIFLVLPVMPLVLLANVIAGIGIAWVVVGIYSAIQLRSPDHLQGRVFSAVDTSLSIPQMISVALGAGLVSVVDYRILAITIAVVCGAAGLWLARRPIHPVAASEPSEIVLPSPDPPVAASDVVDPHPPDFSVETYAAER